MSTDREAPDSVSRPAREWLVIVTGPLLIVLGLLLLGLWWKGGEERALLALPPIERAAECQRQLLTFEALCTPQPSAAVVDACRERARLLHRFPECDSACVALTTRVLEAPGGSR